MINTITAIEHRKKIFKKDDVVEIVLLDWSKVRGRITSLSNNHIILDTSTQFKRQNSKHEIYTIRTIKKCEV